LTKEVEFGRFDPDKRDYRPGVTRRTTHAFRREGDGQWSVTTLEGGPDWQPIGSSGFPMIQLKFGDFTGDGVTDVLAVEEGRWAISESARYPWRRLNPTLKDPVANLFIANMDPDDNVDDILRLDRKFQLNGLQGLRVTFTWWRSRNGTEPWTKWKEYVFAYTIDPRTRQPTPEFVSPGYAFVGRFGAAPGGGTLITDPSRYGHFHSEAETKAQPPASPDWTSQFSY
jgi:hypothetical protein